MRWSQTCLSVLVVLAIPTLVAAQKTREDEIRARRVAKAGQLRPAERGKLEAALFKIEDSLMVERIFNPPRGFYARVGGLPEGGGFGAGPGYPHSNATREVRVSGVVSPKRYWLIEGHVLVPRVASDWLFAEVYARRRDFPQEDFFGLGADSRVTTRTSYALRDSAVNGMLAVRLIRWLTAGERIEYLASRIGRGTDRRFVSIERIFSDAGAPGLAAQPDFVRFESFLNVDYSDPPLNPRAIPNTRCGRTRSASISADRRWAG